MFKSSKVLLNCWVSSLPLCSEAGRERQEGSAHLGAATAGAATPEEAPGAAWSGEDPDGQHRLHPLL